MCSRAAEGNRITGPAGLIGEHRYELDTRGAVVILRHVLDARTEGRMRWQWPLLFEPFHDALIEDSLDRAAARVRHHVPAGQVAGKSPRAALVPTGTHVGPRRRRKRDRGVSRARAQLAVTS